MSILAVATNTSMVEPFAPRSASASVPDYELTPRHPRGAGVSDVDVSGWAAFVAQEDSSVKLGTRVTVRNLQPGDTLRYDYFATPAAPGLTVADTLLRTIRRTVTKDSMTTKAPPYGGTRHFRGCVQIERGGRTSGQVYPAAGPVCWTWSYLRPAAPDPVIDGVQRLTLAPLPLVDRIGTDIGGSCRAWQLAHPGETVWVSDSAVNLVAVAPCTSGTRLAVWQFCVFVEMKDGRKGPARNTRDDYCRAQFAAWVSERQV